MNETEIEALVVRLTGDGSQYASMLKQAEHATASSASAIEAMSSKIEGFKNHLEGFASTAVSALGALGLAGSLTAAFHAFEEKEANIIRMNAALEANGRDVKATTEEYLAFAKEQEKVSTASVGATMGMLKQAESFGLTGEKAKNATAAALQLSYAFGGSAEEATQYLRITKALEEGNVQMAMRFARMVPQLSRIKDETEFLNKVNLNLNAGQRVGIALSETVGHQFERLGRTFKALTIEIGKTVGDGLKPFASIAGQLVELYKGLDEQTRSYIVKTVLLTFAFLALRPALDTALWLMKAVGLQFVWNTAKQVAWLAVWLLQKAALLVWNVVLIAINLSMTIFNISLAFYKFLTGGTVLATIAWGAAMASVKIMIWALTAAQVALNAVMSVTNLLAFVTTLLALSGVVAILGATLYAAYKTVQSLWQIFSTTPQLLGPFKAVGNELTGWVDIFKDIFQAAQVDMPLAAKITAAAWELAAAQLEQLWPPLWQFIRTGFDATATYASGRFMSEFEYVRDQIRLNMAVVLPIERRRLAEENERMIARNDREAVKLEADLRKKLEEAAVQFRIAGSPRVDAAKKALDELRSKIGSKIDATKKNPLGTDTIAENLAHAVEDAKALEAILYGSAAAKQAERAYRSYLDQVFGSNGVPTRSGNDTTVPLPAGGGRIQPQAAPLGTSKAEGLLVQIRDTLIAIANKQPVAIPAAAL